MITGHRPNKLGGYYKGNLNTIRIKKEIKELLNNLNEIVPLTGITGMAIGSDQYFAQACLELEIPYDSYVPFDGQEGLWPTPVKDEYNSLLLQSRDIVKVSQGNYTPKKMKLRNVAMSDEADIAIAVWDGSRGGGTYHCISYLQSKKKVPIIFIEA